MGRPTIEGVVLWLRCVFHDLFGHPVTVDTWLNTLHWNVRCRGCTDTKAFCNVCWHHYTLNL